MLKFLKTELYFKLLLFGEENIEISRIFINFARIYNEPISKPSIRIANFINL